MAKDILEELKEAQDKAAKGPSLKQQIKSSYKELDDICRDKFGMGIKCLSVCYKETEQYRS